MRDNGRTANWPQVNAGAKNMVQAASDDPKYNITATLGPWQLTMGGDGKNVPMSYNYPPGGSGRPVWSAGAPHL